MKFNRILIDHYLQTEEGKKAYEFYLDINAHILNADNLLFENINKQYHEPMQIEFFEDGLKWINESISDNLKYQNESKECIPIEDVDHAWDGWQQLIDEILKKSDRLSTRELLSYLGQLSLLCHYLFPKYYFPYFFENHFYRLEKIFSEFNIPMPELPSKRKYYDRILFYADLCRTLYEFRMQFDLEPAELNVFLYSFAPKLITDFDLNIDLPKPSKVYIAGGSKEDSLWMKEMKADTKACWAGNINTLPGDIVLIYEVSPESSIKTVWRALSPGFYDPFSYYAIRQWVGNPIRIPPITYTELCENEVWKEKGIVKSHMQGIAGTPCTREEYEEILKLLHAKNIDTSALPQVMMVGLESPVDLDDERDVEEKLLEPLLKKLGYTDSDWKRQISVRMGRGQYVYPDYALFPKTKKGEESAHFIWEAKFSIPHRSQLQYDFFQAKSYAMRLGTIGLGLVSLEGICLSLQKDSFSFEKIKSYTWGEIQNPDTFHEILLMISKKRN